MIISVFLFTFCNSQENSEVKINENIFERYYPFDNYYVDLDNLTKIEDSVFLKNFKTESIYNFRFYAPRDFSNTFYQNVEYKGKIFTLQDNILEISDTNSGQKIEIKPFPIDYEIDNIVGKHFLVAISSGVIELLRLSGDSGYLMRKIDEKGNIIFEIQFAHTKTIIEGNIHHSYPYLYYTTCTNDFMVFVSYDDNIPKTLMVSLKDGKITEFDKTFNGVLRTDNEDNIPGFIKISDDYKSFETIILNNSWKYDKLDGWGNSAETLIIDNVLYISFFHSIATGSSLYAFDLTNGDLFWKAEVDQMNVGHSQYSNVVYLSSFNNKIIMEGNEAFGSYLQIFDCKTGEKLFSTLTN